MSLLLARGAKINDTDHAGHTLLHIAARRLDYHGVIALLIEQDADVTIRNSKNDRPVHIAASGDVLTPGLAEKVDIQNGVLTTLTKARGVELMDLPNAEGKTSSQFYKAQWDKWKEDGDRERIVNVHRERNLTSTACYSFSFPVNVERCHE
jgi:hypothetical protein